MLDPRNWIRLVVILLTEALGWALIVLGIVMMPMPGPGVLVWFTGLVVLSTRYQWAKNLRKRSTKMVERSTKESVRTKKRIIFASTMAMVMAGVGIFIFMDSTIPEFNIAGIQLGPKIPAAGPMSGGFILFGALVAQGLIIYGIFKHRNDDLEDFG